MIGYFSQLAHQTGLSFGAEATTMAISPAPEPAVAAERPESAPPAPLHVDEITFAAAPAPPPVADQSQTPTPLSSGREHVVLDRDRGAPGMRERENPERPETQDTEPRPSAAPPPQRVIAAPPEAPQEESHVVFTDADAGAGARPSPTRERSPAGEAEVIQLEDHLDAARQSAPRQSLPMPPASIARVESLFAGRGPRTPDRQARPPESGDAPQSQPAGDRKPTDANRDQREERETIVHRYLKEVRAWVAAPPELDQVELERSRDVEPPPAGHSEVFALEPEVRPAAHQSGRPAALEVQDLSLSIGTISIVIEEPRQPAPAVLPASPRVDRSTEPSARESTRLSRYYLGRW